MRLHGLMTRPSGSHRDQLVYATIDLSNRLSTGWSRGTEHAAPDDPESCASIANEICGRFYPQQTAFVPAEADELRRVAQDIHEVLVDLAADDLETAIPKLNALLAQYPASLHLQTVPPYSLHYHDHSMSAVRGWQVGCSAALASWVSSGAAAYLGCCAATRCDRIFFDGTRNGGRRYCSVQCQDREKVRAYRLRRALESEQSS